MGNTRWRYPVLSVAEADKIICESHKSLRVTLIDGAPHLELFLKDSKGKLFFKTLGRLRKDTFNRYDLELMEEQSPAINIVYYKFKT